ncbi:MAG: acetyltransferase [Flavobacteriales bacterium]
MTAQRLILLGGGGHCRSVIDTLASSRSVVIEGILDHASHAAVDGVPVIGTDERIMELALQGLRFLITVGHMAGPATVRMRLHQLVKHHGGKLTKVVSPLAHASSTSTIGDGTWMGHQAIFGPGAACGENGIINTGALIEHDCALGDHVHVSTRAVLNGGCTVGDGSFIGSGAVVKQGVHIGRGCVIGAGAVVLTDVPDGATVVGIPARPIGK